LRSRQKAQPAPVAVSAAQRLPTNRPHANRRPAAVAPGTSNRRWTTG